MAYCYPIHPHLSVFWKEKMGFLPSLSPGRGNNRRWNAMPDKLCPLCGQESGLAKARDTRKALQLLPQA